MSAVERIARVLNRGYDRMRDRAAFELRPEDAVAGTFDSFRDSTTALLVTFRRNGEPVPSPIWFGLDDRGRAYARTMHDAGKVKRLRNDPRALLAPSNMRGKPTGPAVLGIGRVLPKEEWAHAEAALAAAYGMTRKIYEAALGGPEEMATYIEITPGGASG